MKTNKANQLCSRLLNRTLVWVLLSATPLVAQTNQPGWSAFVSMQPFPPPYLADWENNPTIGSLTVINTMDPPTDIILELTLRRSNGSVLASGRSNPITIPNEVPTQINSDRFIDWGTVTYDASIKDQAIRSGRLPEGEYIACVTARTLVGTVLFSNICASFTIVYPDPPILFLPALGDSVTTQYPVFSWTPVQVPVHYQLQYVLRVAEILPGQTPRQALVANIPQYLNENVSMTNFQYPLDALPLDQGKVYAWQVQAVDQNGYPPATNDGRSEIWTFVLKDQLSRPPTGPPGSLRGRIVFYDPLTEMAPPLLTGMDTVSFETFSSRVDGGGGEVVIPVPCPRDSGAAPTPLPSPIELPSLRVGRNDSASIKSFALYARLPGDVFNAFLDWAGIPTWNHPNAAGGIDFLFTIVWPGQGLPQVALAIKPRMNLLSALGLSTEYAFFILNPLGDFVIDSKLLPLEFRDFYGSNKIPVIGPNVIDFLQGKAYKNLGINFYGIIDMGSSRAVQSIASWAEVDQLKTTIQGFLGLGRGQRSTLVGLHGNAPGVSESSTKWFIRATIPAKVRDPLKPFIKSRWLSLEVGRNDSTFINGIGNYARHVKNKVVSKLARNKTTKADAQTAMGDIEQASFDTTYGYRFMVTDIITLSDDLLNAIDSVRFFDTGDSLYFYGTYGLEANGTPKSYLTGAPTFSMTYGSNITLNLFKNTIKLHSPFIRFNLNERSVALAATFGITTEAVQTFDDIGIVLLKLERARVALDTTGLQTTTNTTTGATPPDDPDPTPGDTRRQAGTWPAVSTGAPAVPQKPLRSYMVDKEQPPASVKRTSQRKWKLQATLLINQQKTIAAAVKLAMQLVTGRSGN